MHLTEKIDAHRAIWMIPVTEPDTVVARITAEIDDDTHQYQADKCDDLDAAKPELKLSEEPYA